ncbi:MAG: bifunctional folylpolyglutamate synthase/dihydrofolate synthase [Solirubrobacteraceae bacterium]
MERCELRAPVDELGSADGVSRSWSPEHAERHLRSLELFGMRFGLDRMRRMMTVLGSPERSFDTIHVVGTNGKTSTTRMIAAILERHGLRTGCFTSPHLVSYAERVQVAERDIETHAFAAAITHAAWAAERVNRTLAEDDHVTQFELLTASAFWELARRDVAVAVIEAGLGGRYDATNVIDSRVAVLTNVGLEHTRWLGPTVPDIANEKLAVLSEGATLVLGAGVGEEVRQLAHLFAEQRSATVVCADPPPAELELHASGSFQRENFMLARRAAQAYLESLGMGLDEEAVTAAAGAIVVPGRAQVVARDPLTLLDGAHNPHAVQALTESLPDLLAGRSLGLVLGVLDDKDAASMLRALLPSCERAWFTAPPSSRALSPAALQSLASQMGFSEAVCEPQPARALKSAQSWARTRSGGGAVLATGSVYLVGELLAHSRELGLQAHAAMADAASSHDIPSMEGRGRI